jgi:predicted  nucleic acid-binding Zn-ribbon protein
MTSSLTRLLDLQELDIAIDQLRHRRTHLPQRAALQKLAADSAAAAKAIQPTVEQRAALHKEEKRLEDDAATVDAKATSEDKRLYSGTVTSPRELQAIQEEITSLKRRQRELEDRALELMVEIEPLDAAITQAEEQQRARDAQVAAVTDELTIAEAEIDVELDKAGSQRSAIAAEFDANVIAQYDALRQRLGGVAVARLEQGSCRGCHLKLSSVDFDRIKKEPPDAIVHCEQCGRILIR